MKKTLYTIALITLAICTWFFAKPYKIFDLSLKQPSSAKDITIYIGLSKIGVEVDKNKLKFNIIDHPGEVNGLNFSKEYEKYWRAKPYEWSEKHGVISAHFYDEFVKIVSQDHKKEDFGQCFIDVTNENITSYICYKANNERVSGFMDNHAKHVKIFLDHVKIYNNQIKDMGPVNECAGYGAYCER